MYLKKKQSHSIDIPTYCQYCLKEETENFFFSTNYNFQIFVFALIVGNKKFQ